LCVASEIHHFYIELFAVILVSALAFYYILRARVLKDNFSLFVGIGFLISGLIDMLHVIVSMTLIENIDFLKYFIPQTWFAGRFFLSAMLLIAVVKYSYTSKEEDDLVNLDEQYNIIQKINPTQNSKKNIISFKENILYKHCCKVAQLRHMQFRISLYTFCNKFLVNWTMYL